MKIKAKDLKPVTKQDKLLKHLLDTKRDQANITYDKSIDGLRKSMVERENYD